MVFNIFVFGIIVYFFNVIYGLEGIFFDILKFFDVRIFVIDRIFVIG